MIRHRMKLRSPTGGGMISERARFPDLTKVVPRLFDYVILLLIA